MTVRVLLVDDQPPFLDAARAVIETLDEFEVIGEAATGEEALLATEDFKPDLVVMDIHLPGINGLEATRQSAPLVRSV